jgi:two-component system CheB/CheR fusion protein
LTTRRRKAAPKTTSPDAPFPVVGIGASAGGLSAIEEFLAALPGDRDLGMAFVLVQHLDPDHKSLLLDLVRQYTRMPIAWAADGMEVQPGHFYVMPPNADVAIMDGRLRLMEPDAPRGRRLPIDGFFRSLAQERRELAVCIVLSGTGSDGVVGLRAVKGEGGMAMAQQPESAAYDAMPRNAIATGAVDYVLTPAEMPAQLVAYADRAFRVLPQPVQARTDDERLTRVLVLLRDRTGHDFSSYKRSTIRRRVARRMVVTQVDGMDDYARILSADAVEVETLFRELLIGVTNFFRDPDAFAALVGAVVPKVMSIRSPGDPVRVWVPACSTGEEAFSIAILLQEYAEDAKRHVPIQIFATDIDTEAIERARAGVYPGSIAADVSPERLSRFFTQEGDGYRVRKSIRDLVVFAVQDVIKDPPFSHLDLISCRNLLIYMSGELQQRLMPLFHYALDDGGYLFLGTSETIGTSSDRFSVVDKKWKIYRREAGVPRAPRAVSSGSGFAPAPAAGRREPRRREPALGVRALAERTLLERHTPAGVLVNADGNVLYFHGRTGRYLEPAAGETSTQLADMARPGLKRELAVGLRKALSQDDPVRFEKLRVKTNGDSAFIDLTVERVEAPDVARGIYLVLFEERADEPAAESALDPRDAPGEHDQRIADLERDLTTKEEYLRTAVEELETSNEELKSTNEELQSSNEELQSTNEELETSKEELQSVNEELVTVNAELQQKIEELSRANNDMNNLLAGTGIGTVYVDHQLLIQRFTPAARQIINLIQADVGRPISDIVTRLDADSDIVSVIRAVLETLAPHEAEVRTQGGVPYLMRVQPYRTTENVIEGAVLTFVDLSTRKKAED